MTFSLSLLFTAAFGYLLLLFFIAYATDRGWIPRSLARHPLTYVLSLGVYATSWTYYGSVGFAATEGYNFLTTHLGVTFAFLLTPVLLMPILRLTREYQLTSLADLFAFRYRSQSAGILVTLFMLVGLLPYIALQIRAVSESSSIVARQWPPEILALGFCIVITVFAILFGARHVTPRGKHEGLVVAIAFESAVKLVALLLVGAAALFGTWGGFGGLSSWLTAHPEALAGLYRPVADGPWMSLLLLAFAAAFLLPRQFHMIFAENIDPRTLTVAAWAFPLFLLLLNLPIPLVLWAGQALQLDVPADYFVLGVALSQAEGSPLAVLAFLGGISAASAMMIVSTLALSSMCLNHLFVPLSYPYADSNLYVNLLWARRVLIALIVTAGYGFYRLLEHKQGLVQLGLLSFVAVAQFLPGIVGVLFWRGATRNGFIAGLLGGIAVWVVTLLLPLLQSSGVISLELELERLHHAADMDKWEFATFVSLTVNGLLFVAGSLLARPRATEVEAAQACRSDRPIAPAGVVAAASPAQFEQRLARAIGAEAARREVQQALADLDMSATETRTPELRRLREQLERNLSGLIGPQLAHMIVEQRLQLAPGAQTALAGTMRYIEARLKDSRARLRGLSAEIDALHRYHRQVLVNLPIAACALSHAREVMIWNVAMELVSGVRARDAIGRPVGELPAPWNALLDDFARAADNHLRRKRIEIGRRHRWFNLHKESVEDPATRADVSIPLRPGVVILLEDLTELETLEAELAHSERLASIGRLAAGVAHEIGNPVTGIACLAQNLRGETDPDELETGITQILEQTRRITGIVQALTNYSHGGAEDYACAPFDLGATVAEAIQLVRLAQGTRVLFEQSGPAGLTMAGDRQRLLQVLVNLLTNACDASEAGCRVAVRIASTSPDGISIAVIDQGTGIPLQHQARIFEPFFTTKEPGEGTGLGLALVYKIVRDHGGRIEVDSEPGQGTRVDVWLPRIPLAAARWVAP
jgi:Na+/proline symporter/nitrogen-specific signal transduction histidine kinase